MRKFFLSTACLLVFLNVAQAAPISLTARTNTLIANTAQTGPDGIWENVRSENFGLVGLLPSAWTFAGAGANNVPYIQFHSASGDTGREDFYTSTNLNYQWRINSENNAPVLVHINNKGWLSLFYALDPDRDFYNLSQNLPAALIFNTLQTQTATGYDSRRFGIQTGIYNLGVDRLTAPSIGLHGGNYNLVGSFDTSFDVWAMPNVINTISMTAESSLYKYNGFNSQYGTEAYNFNGYIDPTITIDAAFADSYRLEVADIPVFGAQVPEPTSILLTGIAGIALIMMRRRKSSV